jgi:two-component system chemotaxis sensor kinase CheA
MGDDLLRDLLATFAVEAREHLQTINDGLLELEKTPGPKKRDGLLSELFRAAHSLKGAARAVGAQDVEAIAHDLETQFDMFRSGELEPSAAAFDAVYRSVDAMGSQVDEVIGAGASDAGSRGDSPEVGSSQGPVPEEPLGDPSTATVDGGRATPTSTEDRTPPAPPLPSARAADETVRVTTSKLDTLVAQVGEMHVAQAESEQQGAELSELLDELTALEAASRKALRAGSMDGRAAVSPPTPESSDLPELDGRTHLQAIRERLGGLEAAVKAGQRRRAQLTADLHEDVRRIRMLPVSTILDAFPRMVRDLAREQRKEIDLLIEGADTEVDRFVLEQIKDPLTHLLRNSIDHGIEKPDDRLGAGKPRRGAITVTATQRGDQLVLHVADDGIGIDPAAVKAAAVSRGMLTPDAARAMDDREALWTIFRSSLSTSPIVTDMSGRGVGLDVVHEAVERLQGNIEVESRVGEGTRFVLSLPLAVAATRCLLVRAGSQTFALPTTSVLRIVHLDPDDMGRAGGQEAVGLDGEPVVLARLAAVLGIDGSEASGIPAERRVAVVLGSTGRQVALLVDGLAGEQDAVIKSLPRPLVRVPGTAGATILGTGEVVLVLSVSDVIRTAGRARAPSEPPSAREAEAMARNLLVVDDSITTRTMEKNILEAAGYGVRVAADGTEAWKLLQQADVQLLVSDVAMPGMDGFELTKMVRAHQRLKDLPVILVTSLASDEHRERGIEVGADAYIVKSAFDQDRLLETVRRLV